MIARRPVSTSSSSGRTATWTACPSRRKTSVGHSLTRNDRPSGFPFPAGTTGSVESAAREVCVAFAFRGSLEDAVDFYAARLLKRGIRIRGQTLHRDGENVRGVTLDLVGIGTGSLELRPGALGGVEGTLLLTLP